MTGALNEKNVLITGATRGLGKLIAGAMWARGANLFLIARTHETLGIIEDELQTCKTHAAQSVHVMPADLGAKGVATQILKSVRKVWPHIHVLVNNAGIQGPIGKAWESDWEQWQETIRVNLLAPVELCRQAVSLMEEQKCGSIINLSGGGATSSRPNFSAYATAKTGLVRFSEILAEELINTGVRVNCVAPGAMPTEMLQTILQSGPEKAGAREYAQAQKTLQAGDAIAQRAAALCAYLASDQSAGITGKLISAQWDPWESLHNQTADLAASDIYTLRRILPKDRGQTWG